MQKIQLMSMDVSRVEYPKTDKEVNKTNNSIEVDPESIALNEESIKKMRARLAKKKIQESIPQDVTNAFNK